MPKQEPLSESLENYLEIILSLEQTHKVARAKDIAEGLNIQRGSVTGALKTLAEKGYINYEPYSYITLTPKGKKRATTIAHRHAAIKEFLVRVLKIDKATAESTACRMEHAIDEKTFERLVCFIEYIFTCPRVGEQWIQSFITYCQSGQPKESVCELCIEGIKEPQNE
jgi:DtxR family Mn-dependent transcriptional regulator